MKNLDSNTLNCSLTYMINHVNPNILTLEVCFLITIISSPNVVMLYTNQVSLLNYRIYFPSCGEFCQFVDLSVNCSGLERTASLRVILPSQRWLVSGIVLSLLTKIVDNYKGFICFVLHMGLTEVLKTNIYTSIQSYFLSFFPNLLI